MLAHAFFVHLAWLVIFRVPSQKGDLIGFVGVSVRLRMVSADVCRYVTGFVA